mmetsp:Transcript_25660/g.56274  ORF Transcript_25660/g.56274 Transcript_25660/m.56274 type:complete len:313 (-) Transcript_25660:178-1116(-)
MTGLIFQSAVLGGVGANNFSAAATAAASSLALAVFRNPGPKDDNNAIDTSYSQQQHAPPNVSGRTRRQDDTTTNTSAATNNNPLVRLYRAWMQLPQIFRFAMAGNLGNLGFFYLEQVIFRCLSHLLITSESMPSKSTSASKTEVYASFLLDAIEKYQDSMSFFSAYMIQIVTTHLLYAFLVYGMHTIDTYEKYSQTLWGQFKVYGFGLFGATALNSFLLGRGMGKTAAFWTTTMTFAMFNYVLVSKVVNSVTESVAENDGVGDMVIGNANANGSIDAKRNSGSREDTKPWRRRTGMQQKPSAPALVVKRVNR